MTRAKVATMTEEQLLDRFIEIGLAQHEALLDDEVGVYNRLFDRMQIVVEELKARPGDQRRKLMRLYDHPNLQIRLKAGIATLAVAPEAARAVLESIRMSQMQPQALDAGMTHWDIDRGVFKPT